MADLLLYRDGMSGKQVRSTDALKSVSALLEGFEQKIVQEPIFGTFDNSSPCQQMASSFSNGVEKDVASDRLPV